MCWNIWHWSTNWGYWSKHSRKYIISWLFWVCKGPPCGLLYESVNRVLSSQKAVWKWLVSWINSLLNLNTLWKAKQFQWICGCSKRTPELAGIKRNHGPGTPLGGITFKCQGELSDMRTCRLKYDQICNAGLFLYLM